MDDRLVSSAGWLLTVHRSVSTGLLARLASSMAPQHVGTLVSVLQGPTQAAVGAGLAAWALSSSGPAHCASYYRQPYDEDVWRVRHGLWLVLERSPFQADPCIAAKSR